MTSRSILLGIVAGALAVGSVSLAVRYFQDIRAAQKALAQIDSQVVETDCGTIEYVRAGEGYPVLVVHGSMGGVDQGLMLAENLGPGFQALVVSRFGYLGSTLPEGADLNMQADAYACLLDRLGIKKVVVYGTSAGATSSIRFAVRYPERTAGLILLSPATPGKVRVDNPPRAALEMMRSDFLYWVMSTYFKPAVRRFVGVPDSLALTPELQAEADLSIDKTLPSSGRVDGMVFETNDTVDEFYAEISETSPYAVSHIQAPTLVISALDDPYAIPENVRGLVEQIPNARRVILPDGGHLDLGRTSEVKAAFAQFLNEVVLEPERALTK